MECNYRIVYSRMDILYTLFAHLISRRIIDFYFIILSWSTILLWLLSGYIYHAFYVKILTTSTSKSDLFRVGICFFFCYMTRKALYIITNNFRLTWSIHHTCVTSALYELNSSVWVLLLLLSNKKCWFGSKSLRWLD